MTYTVLGIFSDRDNAEEAIHDLETAGYNPKNLSIVMKDQTKARSFTINTGADVVGGAVSGATAGIIAGGIAGLLIGVGAIAIPGLGGLLIGGPLTAALGLTGAAATTISGAATGGLAGGLIGALMSLGLPREDATYYEQGIKNGGILIAVPAFENQEDVAKEVLERNGADQIRAIATPTMEVTEEETQEEYVSPRYSSAYGQPAYAYAPSGRKGGKTSRKQKTQRRTTKKSVRNKQ